MFVPGCATDFDGLGERVDLDHGDGTGFVLFGSERGVTASGPVLDETFDCGVASSFVAPSFAGDDVSHHVCRVAMWREAEVD